MIATETQSHRDREPEGQRDEELGRLNLIIALSLPHLILLVSLSL
jgi:hypothetical protein